MLDESAFRGSSLCVVGNINRDVKTAPFAPSESLFRDGETSVNSVIETIGGGGANSAFAAASLGARVTFLGKVGADVTVEQGYEAAKLCGLNLLVNIIAAVGTLTPDCTRLPRSSIGRRERPAARHQLRRAATASGADPGGASAAGRRHRGDYRSP